MSRAHVLGGVVVALALFLAGIIIGRISAPDSHASGVQGTVLFGGCAGVSFEGCHFAPQAACQLVRKAVKKDYDARAKVEARFCSRKDGTYRVSVSPGDYFVESDNKQQRGDLAPSGPIEVQAGGFTSWNLHYDNGLR